MTWPEDWYAFDITDPDLLSAAEALDEFAAFMAPKALTFPATALGGMGDDAEASLVAVRLDLVEPFHPRFCAVIGFGVPGSEFRDAYVSSFIRDVRRRAEGLGWVHAGEPETVSLPVGEATVLWGTAGPDYEQSFEAYADYVLTRGEDAFVLACAGEEPPEDHWLSIAESFEFLPEE
jgi:hypothetical protein